MQYTFDTVKHLREKEETHKLVVGVVANYEYDSLGSNIHQPAVDIVMLMPNAIENDGI